MTFSMHIDVLGTSEHSNLLQIGDFRQDPMFTPVKALAYWLNVHVVYVKMDLLGVIGSYIRTSYDIHYAY